METLLGDKLTSSKATTLWRDNSGNVVEYSKIGI